MPSHGGPHKRFRMCGEQMRGTVALHPLDEVTDRGMRGERKHPIAMLRQAMPLEASAPRLLICFADTSATPFRHRATQPFWRSLMIQTNNREMDRKRRLGALVRAIYAPECTENRLRLLPKGGGFCPSQVETLI